MLCCVELQIVCKCERCDVIITLWTRSCVIVIYGLTTNVKGRTLKHLTIVIFWGGGLLSGDLVPSGAGPTQKKINQSYSLFGKNIYGENWDVFDELLKKIRKENCTNSLKNESWTSSQCWFCFSSCRVFLSGVLLFLSAIRRHTPFSRCLDWITLTSRALGDLWAWSRWRRCVFF